MLGTVWNLDVFFFYSVKCYSSTARADARNTVCDLFVNVYSICLHSGELTLNVLYQFLL